MKPTIPEVAPLVRDIYSRHAAGCCLHIVLDDHNVANSSVDLCIDCAEKAGHERCWMLAKLLRLMSKTQRRKLGMLRDKRQ